MKPSNRDPSPAGLPLTHSLTLSYVFSLFTVLIMATTSAASLVYPARIYGTDELQQSFVANDVVNLAIGVPILLGSMWLTRRGRLVGLLFWPGALFYVLYNYIAYLFGTPFNALFLPYLALVTLSAYTTISLVASIDGKAVQGRLSGIVPEKVAGGVLVGMGVAFFLRVIGTIFGALTSQATISATEASVLVSDFLLSPASVIGGVLLWRRRALGYVSGAGLLFQASMLFIGLIVFLILQPLLTTAPFALVDVVVVLIMGLICFVPFGLFVRGVLSERMPS